jgi:cephalosporin hydroxylase
LPPPKALTLVKRRASTRASSRSLPRVAIGIGSTGKEAFELISDLWLKTSWNQKYSYTFTWLGRPIIQHPEDLVRLREVIFTLRPDVIIETGLAHGGSLIFYASLFKAMGREGRVIGIDIEIRSQNRKAIKVTSSLITFLSLRGILPTPKW